MNITTSSNSDISRRPFDTLKDTGIQNKKARIYEVVIEIFHQERSTDIRGYNKEAIIEDLFSAVAWFRGASVESLSENEKLIIKSNFATLARQLELAQQLSSILLPLNYFVPDSSSSKPLRIGLEAEYSRFVRSPESAPNQLKYDQLVGRILAPGTNDSQVLALIKLDGISSDKKSAILELELRPYSLNSKEFSQQLKIINDLGKVILQAKKDSSVQELLDSLCSEGNNYEILVERKNTLIFDSPESEVGPFCQVTVELPLSRLGDPKDKAILDLIDDPEERELLQHARIAANALVGILRPFSAQLHGDIYEMKSIKLSKLRGYWAQSIMQACQKVQYGTKKDWLSFHIRAAGPRCLSAREKILMNKFFDTRPATSELTHFKNTLKKSLEEGIKLLSSDDQKDDSSIQSLVDALTKCSYDFEPRFLQFKSVGRDGNPPDNLEFRYGMTLVELRAVRSSLNKGIIVGSEVANAQIIKAQALPENRSKKILKVE